MSVKEQDAQNYVILSEVIDTGIGISEGSSANLFKPFTQLEETTRKRYQGTGLGLSISKSLAELMGGEIGYRPNPGQQGSIFWFTAKFKRSKIPDQFQTLKENLAQHQMSRTTSMSPTPASDDPASELKTLAPTKHLLVVEDNAINQKVLIKTLHALGFSRVALAADGAQAVASKTNPSPLFLPSSTRPSTHLLAPPRTADTDCTRDGFMRYN